MPGNLLGWAAITVGTLMTLRGLFGHSRSFGQVMSWIAVGLGTTIFGLWQIGYFDLPHFIIDSFRRN